VLSGKAVGNSRSILGG